MTDDARTPRGPYADIAPALDEYTQKVLFGEVWERPGLSKRDRSLVTVAALVAGYRINELPFHLKRAAVSPQTSHRERRHPRRADRGDPPLGVLRRLARRKHRCRR